MLISCMPHGIAICKYSLNHDGIIVNVHVKTIGIMHDLNVLTLTDSPTPRWRNAVMVSASTFLSISVNNWTLTTICSKLTTVSGEP